MISASRGGELFIIHTFHLRHPQLILPSLNRKTGIQVPTQERDAFGLENPEGFFTPSPAPEKVSRPLNAFLSGTQGGGVNASPAPAMAAAALKAVAQVVGDVTSGEESMDLDSGVDSEWSFVLCGVL